MSDPLVIRPACSQWRAKIERQPEGALAGRTLQEWRALTRAELGLATDQPIIATGHQTLLWHPGILAKYLVCDAFAKLHQLATANLIVDQHVGEFGVFDIPIRREDGSLGVRTVELCRPREEVPMGRHPSFAPSPAWQSAIAMAALPSVTDGVKRVVDAVNAHRDEPNAALQMAAAIADLMESGGWVRSMPNVTSTQLISTSLAHAMMLQMIADPKRCAECYNRAVAAIPESGIGELEVIGDRVELPVWRIGDGDKRVRGYDRDVAEAIGPLQSKIQSRCIGTRSKIDLLPRALFMTALVRLDMCDLFIHGTGGANYDRAMELWIKDWLGIEVGSIAVVTADVRLPLMQADDAVPSIAEAEHDARRLWHDPESAGASQSPSASKTMMVKSIEGLPRNSSQRRAQFLAMHEELNITRAAHEQTIRVAQRVVEQAKRLAADRAVADRRDWAFPLYPRELIDDLARSARQAVTNSPQSFAD